MTSSKGSGSVEHYDQRAIVNERGLDVELEWSCAGDCDLDEKTNATWFNLENAKCRLKRILNVHVTFDVTCVLVSTRCCNTPAAFQQYANRLPL